MTSPFELLVGRGLVGEGSERATEREPEKRARATDWKEEMMKKRKGKRGAGKS